MLLGMYRYLQSDEKKIERYLEGRYGEEVVQERIMGNRARRRMHHKELPEKFSRKEKTC